jgi:hypothetical protein
LKNPSQKWVGGVGQGEGSEFKPKYHTHTHTKSNNYYDKMDKRSQKEET